MLQNWYFQWTEVGETGILGQLAREIVKQEEDPVIIQVHPAVQKLVVDLQYNPVSVEYLVSLHIKNSISYRNIVKIEKYTCFVRVISYLVCKQIVVPLHVENLVNALMINALFRFHGRDGQDGKYWEAID